MLLVLFVRQASLRGLSQNYSIDVKKFALLKLFLGEQGLLIFLWSFSFSSTCGLSKPVTQSVSE